MKDGRLILLVIAAIFAIVVMQTEMDGNDVPNNEPYTGLCVRPSAQGGC